MTCSRIQNRNGWWVRIGGSGTAGCTNLPYGMTRSGWQSFSKQGVSCKILKSKHMPPTIDEPENISNLTVKRARVAITWRKVKNAITKLKEKRFALVRSLSLVKSLNSKLDILYSWPMQDADTTTPYMIGLIAKEY